ncbi:MAG: hypothetical protein ACYTGW_21395 [Planctomycetota bacterium]|jgi:hypothetical protein
MKRWIVEGIRQDDGRWDARVEIVEAATRAHALAQVSQGHRMHPYEVSVRPALPGDNPEDLQRQLAAAVNDAGRELDRLVSDTAAELELQGEIEQEMGGLDGQS